jgi:hypothetical protein
VRRIPFHLDQQTTVLLPPLLGEDGAPVDLSTYTSIALVVRRDDHDAPGETTQLGFTPPAGTTAGTLFVHDAAAGVLGLIVDPFYFSPNIPAYGVIYKDGADYPQDGRLIFVPQEA